MRNILNMLKLVEAEIQACQVVELIQTLEVGDKVVIKIKLSKGSGDIRREADARYLVLAQA